jgi:hypothetical protein
MDRATQLRSDIVTSGKWLSRVLRNPTEAAQQAGHVVARMVDFVAAVWVLLDYIPDPVKAAIADSVNILAAFKF